MSLPAAPPPPTEAASTSLFFSPDWALFLETAPQADSCDWRRKQKVPDFFVDMKKMPSKGGGKKNTD